MRLRGANRSGLEYCSPVGEGSLSGAHFSENEFSAMAAWGFNAIRLPINQHWTLASDDGPASYRAAIDWVIGHAAQQGLYTILDLQWIDAHQQRGQTSDGKANFVPPLPNLDSIALWELLAQRYASEPAVLYDIFNEPHDALANDLFPMQGIRADRSVFPLQHRRVTPEEWVPWALHMTTAIRERAPNAVIFVSGVDWGYDLRSLPSSALKDVVYSSHVYPTKKLSWERAFGNVARTHPVFIAELGGTHVDLDWGAELLRYLDKRSLGWAAWSWIDHPRLTTDLISFDPTPFGRLIQQSLATG